MSAVVREKQVVRYRAAGFWRRFRAASVDGLLLLPCFAIVGLGLAVFFGGRVPRLHEIGMDYLVEMLLGREPLVIGGFVLCALITGLYFVLFVAGRGQTLGKRLFGLQVITLNGARP